MCRLGRGAETSSTSAALRSAAKVTVASADNSSISPRSFLRRAGRPGGTRGGTVRTGTGASFAITGVALLRDRIAWTTITIRMKKTTEATTLTASVVAACALICHHPARRPPAVLSPTVPERWAAAQSYRADEALTSTALELLASRMGKVVQVTRFGPPEVLATIAVPDLVPGPGEVIIAVSAADVLLLDAVIRSGLAAAWFPLITPPYVPGNGVAGRVSAVGEGVDRGWTGQLVDLPLLRYRTHNDGRSRNDRMRSRKRQRALLSSMGKKHDDLPRRPILRRGRMFETYVRTGAP